MRNDGKHTVIDAVERTDPHPMDADIIIRFLDLCRRVRPPHFFWRSPDGDTLLCAGARNVLAPPDTASWREWCRAELPLDDGIPAVFLSYFNPTEKKHPVWKSFTPVSCFQSQAGMLLRPGTELRWGSEMRSESEMAIASDVDSMERGIEAAGAEDDGPENPRAPGGMANGDVGFSRSDERQGAEAYRARVNRVLTDLRAGTLGKVVMAREFRTRLPRPFDLARSLGSMLRLRDSFAVCYSPDGVRYFLSATPERLGRITEGRFETIALAGTMAETQATCSAKDLLTDEKEHREHAFVVEMIRAACDTFATEVTVDAARVLSLPHVRHMLTRFSGSMRGGHGLRHVIAALHPTPAVGGTPRSEAMRLIEEIEPFGRGMYAGCAAWFLGDGDGDAAVTIRSALLRHDEAILWAGAGIVRESEAEAEERETWAKLRTMRDILDRE